MSNESKTGEQSAIPSRYLLGRGACIVVFDDDAGFIAPMGWDEECEGALEYGRPVVVFPDRKAAQKAIRVSKKWAALRQAQGKVVNTDFLPECAKCIQIIPVKLA